MPGKAEPQESPTWEHSLTTFLSAQSHPYSCTRPGGTFKLNPCAHAILVLECF